MEKISFKLPVFEGPMDLLLHLINKHKLNIYDIPITELVDQYLEYVRRMQDDMDVASEFLDMAARLVYIKTVSLLPVQTEAEELKKELSGELLEYRDCQLMAEKLSHQVSGFDSFVRKPQKIEKDFTYTRMHETKEILDAYLMAVGKGQRKLPPPAEAFSGIVSHKIVSVGSKIVYVMKKLWNGSKVKFGSLFESAKSRSEIVATFLAVLELIKAKRVYVNDSEDDTEVQMVMEAKDA